MPWDYILPLGITALAVLFLVVLSRKGVRT